MWRPARPFQPVSLSKETDCTLFSKASESSCRLLARASARDSRPWASPWAWLICSCLSPSATESLVRSWTVYQPTAIEAKVVPEARTLARFLPSAMLMSASRMPSDSRMAARFLRSASTCICMASWTRAGSLMSPAPAQQTTIRHHPIRQPVAAVLRIS